MTSYGIINPTGKTRIFRWSIRKKLVLFTAGIFILLLSIGGYDSYVKQHLKNLEESEQQLVLLSANSIRLRWTEQKFLTQDLIQSSFFRTGSSKNLRQFDSLLSSSKVLLRQIENSPANKSAQFSNAINKLTTTYDQYVTSFSALVEAKKRRGFKDYGLVGMMRQSVHDLFN